MARIEHPVFPDQTREVSDDSLDGWVASGWVPANKDGSSPAPNAENRKKAAKAAEENRASNEPVVLGEGPEAFVAPESDDTDDVKGA